MTDDSVLYTLNMRQQRKENHKQSYNIHTLDTNLQPETASNELFKA
jgi:hypothetical protein